MEPELEKIQGQIEALQRKDRLDSRDQEELGNLKD